MQRALIAVVVVVAACVAPKTDPRYAQGSGSDTGGDELVCHEVSDTGTMFSHQECVPRRTIDERHNDPAAVAGAVRIRSVQEVAPVDNTH